MPFCVTNNTLATWDYFGKVDHIDGSLLKHFLDTCEVNIYKFILARPTIYVAEKTAINMLYSHKWPFSIEIYFTALSKDNGWGLLFLFSWKSERILSWVIIFHDYLCSVIFPIIYKTVLRKDPFLIANKDKFNKLGKIYSLNELQGLQV